VLAEYEESVNQASAQLHTVGFKICWLEEQTVSQEAALPRAIAYYLKAPHANVRRYEKIAQKEIGQPEELFVSKNTHDNAPACAYAFQSLISHSIIHEREIRD
jgi:multidrug resistance efflux pump